ncbi:MAG: hypothetical protein ABIO16_06185 [Nocardioides sp.]
MRFRLLIGAIGVAGAAYGAWLLLQQDYLSTAVWLAVGVVLHDFVLVPLTLGLGWVAVRVVPPGWRSPLAVGLLVLGSVTLMAVPVLGGWGANTDNATILDRHYVTGWLVVATLVLAGVVAGAVLSRRRSGGASARRR